MFLERELVTPPLNGLILPGITRDSILHLTKQWNDCKVSEATITMEQICKLIKEERVSHYLIDFFCHRFAITIAFLFQLLEMFGSGTACIVSPIERISYLGTDLQIPTMFQEKPIWKKIVDTLTAIQYGKINHPWAMAID